MFRRSRSKLVTELCRDGSLETDDRRDDGAVQLRSRDFESVLILIVAAAAAALGQELAQLDRSARDKLGLGSQRPRSRRNSHGTNRMSQSAQKEDKNTRLGRSRETGMPRSYI